MKKTNCDDCKDGELFLFDNNIYMGCNIYKCMKCGMLSYVKNLNKNGGKK